MAGILLIQDLAVVLLVAGAAAWLCQRAGLSVIVGYLVAGAAIGPNTPPFALVSDLDRVQTLAQLGLVFLVFSIGLNLSLSRLKRLGLSIIVATAIGAVLVLNGGRLFGVALGWSGTAGLFLAAMLMVSSSAIISKVLAELKLSHERAGQLALGMTVLEDVVAIVMLTLLTSLVQFGGAPAPAVLPTLGALLAFVVLIALLSLLIMPKLLTRLSHHAVPEIRTLVVGGVLLALAWLAVKMGYSLALGAFVFGAIIGSTRYKDDVEQVFGGLDQIFGAVFFVAVGMLVDFRLLLEAWPLLLGVTLAAVLLRPLAATLGFIAVGNTSREALRAGLAVVPLGEFSFIIAQLGVTGGVLPASVYPVAVGASLLTSLVAPVLTRRAEAWSERWVGAAPPFLGQWIEFYHGLLQRLRARQGTSVVWKLTGKRLVQVGVHVLFVSALLLFAAPLFAWIKELAGLRLVSNGSLPYFFWSMFGLVLLGPLIAIWRNIAALAMIISEAATTGARRQARLRPLLEAALQLVAFAVLTSWLLALLPSGWSFWGVAGVVFVTLAVIGAVFWRRFIKLHSRLEIELAEQFKRASNKMVGSAWAEVLPDQTAGWDLDLEAVTLPSDTALAGKTLAQLAVRQQFGCSVVGLDRQGFNLVNPAASTVLFPQDKLLLLGHASQLSAAARVLSTASATANVREFEDLTLETVLVPAGSPLAGQTLLELNLIHAFGIQLGGIRRAGQRILSLSGRDRIEVGDALLVLGAHPQIKAFAARLAPPPETESRADVAGT